MSRFPRFVSVLCCVCAVAQAENQDAKVAARLGKETRLKEARLVATAIGVTRQGTSIPCWMDRAELVDEPSRTHVWLVGGLDGSEKSVEATTRLLRWFHSAPDAESLRKQFAVSGVLIANPDGWALGSGEKNASNGQPTRGFPPAPDGYQSPTSPEAQYLWRWLGTQAPDIVVEVRVAGEGESTRVIPGERSETDDGLAAQLNTLPIANMGPIPARQMLVGADSEATVALFHEVLLPSAGMRSTARRERLQRIARTPRAVATQLGQRYGHSLKTVQYIPAVAVIGRMRLARQNGKSMPDDIANILAPYVEGQQRAISDKPSGSDFAGHLLFGELALQNRDQKLVTLAKAAADFAFDENGKPRAAMPAHSEMSDAVFMSCPLLAQVGRLTGDAKYFDMCARHLAFMQKLCLRNDGLYRHSPLDEAAWGRGNGFPALGLAWALDNLPPEHPSRVAVLRSVQEHMAVLKKHQDPTGMWHQVIDHPGSYRELTATCMITYAMLRGMRSGWLDRAAFEPCVRQAWPAIAARVAADGSLIDVCEGTGKQPNLRAYFDRKAILGPDDRGGAMSLLVAVEMDLWQTTTGAK